MKQRDLNHEDGKTIREIAEKIIDLALAGDVSAFKEARDTVMRAAHDLYPQYGFGDHVGYGTKSHLQALQEHGITPLHRRNFAPIRNMVGRAFELVEG